MRSHREGPTSGAWRVAAQAWDTEEPKSVAKGSAAVLALPLRWRNRQTALLGAATRVAILLLKAGDLSGRAMVSGDAALELSAGLAVHRAVTAGARNDLQKGRKYRVACPGPGAWARGGSPGGARER